MKLLDVPVCVYFLLGFLLFFSCSDEPSEPEVMNTVSDLLTVEYVLDFENNGDASDLIVQYSVNDISNLSEVWLFIAPVGNFASINSMTLADLSSNRYQSISISRTLSQFSPSQSLLDTEGNQITINKMYRLGFATIKSGEISRDMTSRTFELRDQHYLAGTYIGLWNDEMFTDFTVSVELTSVGNILRGPAYFTHSFMPAYGGNDDGSMSFEVDGDQIQNVNWNDDLTDFMGGCTGLWTGDGNIDNLVKLNLELEGENCLYDSQNVEVELSRIFL